MEKISEELKESTEKIILTIAKDLGIIKFLDWLTAKIKNISKE